jgi:hypothetical protein
VLLIVPLGAGCSTSIRAVDAPRMTLAPDEREAVSTQAETARKAGEWSDAWNQAVEAGGDRERLEAIAVDALLDDDDDGDDMLAEVRRVWGGFGPAAEQRIDAAIEEAITRGRWSRAIGLAIRTADDAPKYERAWDVYRRAPADEAGDLLEDLREARGTDGEEEEDAPPDDGTTPDEGPERDG